jgi:phospholipase C
VATGGAARSDGTITAARAGVRRRWRIVLIAVPVAVALAFVAAVVAFGSGGSTAHANATVRAAYSGVKASAIPASIHKIKHVVVIMQENRSFDSYFGTYPGADGFPTKHGRLSVCVPNPATHRCDYPYHDPALVNVGAKHNAPAAIADIAGGKMNGFIAEAQRTTGHTQADVMGYHDAREIPNYWTYARGFVLQDHMFEPDASWSLPAHLFTVSEWAASCLSGDPASCVNDDNQGNFSENAGGSVGGRLAKIIYPHLNQRDANVERVVRRRESHKPRRPSLPHSTDFAWTDMTYLLYRAHVSWRYYVAPGRLSVSHEVQEPAPSVHCTVERLQGPVAGLKTSVSGLAARTCSARATACGISSGNARAAHAPSAAPIS